MTKALSHQDATCLSVKRKWYIRYQEICRPEALVLRRKKRPGWGWLLIAVIIIDSLLAAGAWFAVGYIVQ
jgi:hypothetical protein